MTINFNLGDHAIVTGDSHQWEHYFEPGQVVEIIMVPGQDACSDDEYHCLALEGGDMYYVHMDDLKPVAEDELDMVNHPPHYNFGKIEVIDAIEDWNLPYFLGNVVKYVARCDYKGKPLEDLEKAVFYLNREIQRRRKVSEAPTSSAA